MPILNNNNTLTEVGKLFAMERVFTFTFDGSSVAIYTPIDPQTNRIPDDIIPKYIKKTYKIGNKSIPILYSPNLHHYYLLKPQTIPILITNYGLVLEYKYYGEEQPPERPIEEQIKDWKNGYMWARVKIPNSTYTEEYIRKIEEQLGIKIKRGWYWVKYHARLIELPSQLINLGRGILVLQYNRIHLPNISPIIDTTLINSLMDYFNETKIKNTVKQLESILNGLGLKITNDKYIYGGKEYQGITILISNDKNYYIVIIPLERTTEEQYIQAVIIIGILIIAAVFATGFYMWSKAQVIDAEAKKQYTETINTVLDNLTPEQTYELLKEHPELLDAYGELEKELNKNPSGDSLLDYVKWGALGIGALVGGILVLTLISYLPKSNR